MFDPTGTDASTQGDIARLYTKKTVDQFINCIPVDKHIYFIKPAKEHTKKEHSRRRGPD
jgi:hypothetical protein